MQEIRECGECTVCCRVAAVEELKKDAHVLCKHACSSKQGSCSIFESAERPSVCNTFECSWKRGYGHVWDRPDLNGVMVSVNDMNGGRWIIAIEDKPNAVRKSGKDIVLDVATKVDLPVIISNFGARPPNDKGDEVIVKDSLLPRAKQLVGEKIDQLQDGFGIYDLKVYDGSSISNI